MIVWLVFIVITLFWGITRGIPILFSWVIKYKLNWKIKIKRITIPRFHIEELSLEKWPLNIKIEKVKLTSSLFNNEERKLFVVRLFDVRIEKEHNDSSHKVSYCAENLAFNLGSLFNNSYECTNKIPLYIELPSSVVSLVQFFAVRIENLSVMYLREEWPKCLFHSAAEQIILEGATRNDTNLAINGKVSGIQLRVLKHSEELVAMSKTKKLRENNQVSDPTLIESSMTCNFYIELQAETKSEMDTISFHLLSPEICVSEELINFLGDKNMMYPPVRKKKSDVGVIEDILKKYWFFLPLKFQFKCDGFSIKIINKMGQNITKGSFAKFDLETHFVRNNFLENLTKLPDINSELQCEGLQINGCHETFMSFSHITVQAKFIENRINIKMQSRTLSVHYDYNDLQLFMDSIQRRREISTEVGNAMSLIEEDRESDVKCLYCIGVIFELWDVSVTVSLPTANGTTSAYVSMQHFRYGHAITQGNTELAAELLAEMFLIRLTPENNLESQRAKDVTCFKKGIHEDGTAISIGLCLIEVSSVLENIVVCSLKIEALLDCVQLEWSATSSNFIECCVKYASCINESVLFEKNSRKSTVYSPSLTVNTINGKGNSINIFFNMPFSESNMIRVDVIDCYKSEKKSKISLNGMKCVRFTSKETPAPCFKSNDITNEWSEVSSLTVEFIDSEILISIKEVLDIRWCPTIHMTLVTILQDISSFTTANFRKKSKSGDNLRLQIIAKGQVKFGAQISRNHRVDFITGNVIYLMADRRISVQSPLIKIMFDNNETFLLKEIKLVKTLQASDVKEERESFDELILKNNSAWKLKVDMFKLKFHHQYNFSEAFSEDLISIFKWLKIVHKKESRTTSVPYLPSDTVIQIRKFVAELCDDPFEVKLRYNYELMEDEYQESCKRLEALEKKIEETRKTNLQLISGKIEGLYKALQDLNSETYIKRSKKMYSKEPIRTQLFLWQMDDVLLYALADSSFHGKEKVIQVMKEIDIESPYPEEGVEFVTLWCRMVSASCSNWRFQLRDYPQSLWHMKEVDMWGKVIGAVQRPARRAKRNVNIHLEAPWSPVNVERSLTRLKFYHDLTIESSYFEAAYGPCWEPAMAQFNLAMNLVNRPSSDPSRPLPWWDKFRLLLHGRMTLFADKLTLLLHASLDPYNTTEEMELSWNGLQMNWTNANMIFNGDLSVFVRTASKYDDARLLHFPNLKLSIKIAWVCQGNPNDHHAVMPCAPDKLPEYSINQEHDTYRVFRSQKLKLNISLETKLRRNEVEVAPVQLLFYGSTLRWFENLKFILSGVSRPTRRGILFRNTIARRPQLSRHYESIHLSLSFQRIDVRYWMSVRVKKGFHMSGERLSLSSEHSLALNSITDGLIHRSQANWSICFMNTELCQVQIWLQSVIDSLNKTSETTPRTEETPMAASAVEKFYFLHLTKVSYMRELLQSLYTFSNSQDSEIRETPNHRLVVHNLKGVWTTSTRDVMFALYDSWNKTSLMKQNLSPNILKNVMPGANINTQKPRSWSLESSAVSPPGLLQVNVAVQNTPSPRTRLQSDHACSMLQQLVAEAENHFVVYANDCSTPEPRDQSLQKVKSVYTIDDVICKTWLIELENSQVLFRGCETEGYVIASAAHSQISQRIHRPTWKDHSLVAKTTWTGSLECMQYYATVNEGQKDSQMDNIMWLTVDNIEEKDCAAVINEVTDIVGSGQSVGGVVSDTVGATDPDNESLQLQRIVSRCRCEFFYVSYGETGLDPSLLDEVQPPPNVDEALWKTSEEPADTFNLRHYDLCASTNSLQYNMVLDILNNLLLYADPHKKESLEGLARMRFKLQLHSSDDQRKPIINLQNRLRFQLSRLRFLEKEIYLLQRQIDKKATNDLIKKIGNSEIQVSDCKEKVTLLSDELAMRIHLYNETRVSFNRNLSHAAKGDGKEKSLMRMNEVYFRKAQWRLTEADGQLAICQLDLSNFLYSKKTFSDDITEHLLELGFINISNLLPNQIYTNVLAPSEIKNSMPVDRQKTLRIYCRQKPPCGGISIIEHLEINVVPLKIGLSDYFIQRMMKFCFPYNQPDEDDVATGKNRSGSKSLTKPHHNKVSNFYVDLQKDEVEIMKLRAEQNKLFVYIKITDVPVDFSYKGKKSNIFSMENTPLLIRTIEYHSVTWTWLDLLMAVKQTSKSLIKQAIRNKLNLPRLMKPDEETTESNEEEKKRLIFGSKYLQHEKRAGKKNLFRLNK